MNPKHKAKHVAAKVKVVVPKILETAIDEIHLIEELNAVPVKEFIQWAAIRVLDPSGDRIFKGWDHSSCTDRIREEPDYLDNLCHWQREEGFLTNEGRFVTRSEAYRIAKGEPGWLESWMINDDPRYGKDVAYMSLDGCILSKEELTKRLLKIKKLMDGENKDDTVYQNISENMPYNDTDSSLDISAV